MRQYWVSPIGPFASADGATLASSVSLLDISPAPQITLPANTLEVGMRLQLEAFLTFSTTATPTLLAGFYYGGIAGSALAASSAVTTGTATAWSAILRYRGQVRAIGTSGSIVGQGEFLLGTSLTAFSARAIPEVAASRTVTIDTTTAKALTVGAQWGTSSPSNTLALNDFTVTLLN